MKGTTMNKATIEQFRGHKTGVVGVAARTAILFPMNAAAMRTKAHGGFAILATAALVEEA